MNPITIVLISVLGSATYLAGYAMTVRFLRKHFDVPGRAIDTVWAGAVFLSFVWPAVYVVAFGWWLGRVVAQGD